MTTPLDTETRIVGHIQRLCDDLEAHMISESTCDRIHDLKNSLIREVHNAFEAMARGEDWEAATRPDPLLKGPPHLIVEEDHRFRSACGFARWADRTLARQWNATDDPDKVGCPHCLAEIRKPIKPDNRRLVCEVCDFETWDSKLENLFCGRCGGRFQWVGVQ